MGEVYPPALLSLSSCRPRTSFPSRSCPAASVRELVVLPTFSFRRSARQRDHAARGIGAAARRQAGARATEEGDRRDEHNAPTQKHPRHTSRHHRQLPVSLAPPACCSLPLWRRIRLPPLLEAAHPRHVRAGGRRANTASTRSHPTAPAMSTKSSVAQRTAGRSRLASSLSSPSLAGLAMRLFERRDGVGVVLTTEGHEQHKRERRAHRSRQPVRTCIERCLRPLPLEGALALPPRPRRYA
jgi:hypothetical protein